MMQFDVGIVAVSLAGPAKSATTAVNKLKYIYMLPSLGHRRPHSVVAFLVLEDRPAHRALRLTISGLDQLVEANMTEPIEILRGARLTSVEFVHDYVQLRFDGPYLTINAPFEMEVAAHGTRKEPPGIETHSAKELGGLSNDRSPYKTRSCVSNSTTPVG
jgi:hypothetical protein